MVYLIVLLNCGKFTPFMLQSTSMVYVGSVCNGVFTLPDSDTYADADTKSCTEKVTMHDNGMT